MIDPWEHQTSRLKSLHASLGLPPSALAEDITDIENAMRRAVNSVVQGREEAVKELEKKIEVVKMRIKALNEVMGGGKEESETVEGSLPVRLDTLQKLAEGLQSQYDERKQLLTDAQRRCNDLKTRLGSSFALPSEIVEIINKPTVNLLEACTSDPVEVIEEQTIQAYDKAIELCLEEQKRRAAALNDIFDDLRFLHTELCIPPLHPQPSDVPLHLLPVPGLPLLETRSIFGKYEHALQEFIDDNASSGEGTTISVKIEPSAGLMSWAEKLQLIWTEEKGKREACIQTLYDQLEPMWQRLEYDADFMNDFVDSHCGLNQRVIEVYETELARVRQVRKERLGTFIEKVRDEIQALWDALLYGQQTMELFELFFSDTYTEEILTLHEEEVVRLQEELEVKSVLIAKAREWMDLRAKEEELEAKSKGPDRFNTRGGALLLEERLRKRIAVLKPKLETELMNIIPRWEADHDMAFLVQDVRVIDLISEEIRAKEEAIEAKRRAKFGGSSTPGRASRPTTPGNGLNASRSSKTPSKRGAPTPTPTVLSTTMKRSRLAPGSSLPTPGGRFTSAGMTTQYGSPMPKGGSGSGPLSRSCSTPAPPAALGSSASHSVRAFSAQHGNTHGSGSALSVSQVGAVLGKANGTRPRRQSFKPRPSLANTPGRFGHALEHGSLITEEEL